MLICADKEYPVHTYANQYYSLMTLIADYTGMNGFGICSGMGSCGTCMVAIRESFGLFEKNALSCGLKIDDSFSNTTIIISGNNY